MHYQLQLKIEVPRERVIELFLDPKVLTRWQPDLVSFQPINECEARSVGAKTRQVHKMQGLEVEIIETITVHNSPDEFCASYEADGVWSLVQHRFCDIDGRKTEWFLHSECKFSGMFSKLKSIILPVIIKRQTFTHMQRFKDFAEHFDR